MHFTRLRPRITRRTSTVARYMTTVLTVGALMFTGTTPVAMATPKQASSEPLIADPLKAANAVLKDASPLDELGRPKPEILNQMRNLAHHPGMDPTMRDMILAAVSYYEGDGESGVNMPALADAPDITQFAWPAVAGQCIGGSHSATGTAFAVAGPAQLPLPGVPENHTAFVFTALGTGAVAQEQHSHMTVQWVNVNTMKHGVVPLTFNGINPDGPATVSGTADTGRGTIVAWLSGGVSTKEKNSEGAETTATCNFTPTAGIVTN